MKDSLGNFYAGAPSGSKKGSKGTKKNRKFGRNRKPSEWRQKVKSREAVARSRGHKFPVYPC